MAQNITLLGASYSDVPAVELPKTGGGTASFIDISDTTATAEDVAQGKYFYGANGVRTLGTATGGTGGVYMDADGYLVLDDEGGGSANDVIEHNIRGAVTSTATSLSNFSYIGQSITSVDLPNVTTLKNINNNSVYTSQGLFAFCTSLTTVSAPNVTNVSDAIFKNDTALVSVNMGALKDSGADFCNGCTSLQTIVLPSVQIIYAQAFKGCINLETVDVLASTGFTSRNSFNGCTKLNKLIIRKNGVATLSNINNFTGTPFASDGTGGTLYVPQALISSYQTAENWSTILGYANNSIQAIEGSQYEHYYADGTEIPT